MGLNHVVTKAQSRSEFLKWFRVIFLNAIPCDSVVQDHTRSLVSDLSVEAGVKGKVTHPWQRPRGLDECVKLALHDVGL